MYYGYATDEPGNPAALRSAAHRRDGDGRSGVRAPAATVATAGELPRADLGQLNSPERPLQIVSQRTIDGYGASTPSQPRLIAVSGTNFRVFADPGAGATATLRYYQKLATPAGATVNAILAEQPRRLSLSAAWSRRRSSPRTSRARCATCALQRQRPGLNARTQRITGSLRAGDPACARG